MSNLLVQRPNNIFSLFSSLKSINGVGEKKIKILEKKIGPYLINLLFYLPLRSVNRFEYTSLKTIKHNEIITCELEVVEINIPPYNYRKKVNVSKVITFGLNNEKNVRLDIIYFGRNTQYLKNIYQLGKKLIVSGKFESFNGLGQIVHPDYVLPIKDKKKIPKIENVYSLFEGVNQKFISKIIIESFDKIPNIPEWLSEKTVKENQFVSWKTSIKKIHVPDDIYDNDLNNIYRRRLALDELIANQISMKMLKNKISKNKNNPVINESKLITEFYKSIPFKLTQNQEEVINEIKNDISSKTTMIRMLQGDVGSGKTIVALISMLYAISNGSQAVLLVPTEILAVQHYNNIKKLTENLNLEVDLLLGESKHVGSKKSRLEIIEKIKCGVSQIIIGTHALFSKKISYHNLSLAVIDEQHRFGVKQRLEITEKGENVDVLVMTATPIPRSLALTAYGDLDISSIKEKPSGRTPIKTYVMPQSKLENVLLSINRAINNGDLIYWVCPLIEESESLDIVAVNERYEFLQNYFNNFPISLVHGKQKQDEREKSIEDFRMGKSKILVATTVIEVGVDIPDATIMVIECAERFGLAQIHQLRGRVGRSDKQSSCILLYKSQLTQIAHSRLKILKESDNGFEIAESDLILRGQGEILGSKQSGNFDFKFVDLHFHSDLISLARKEAEYLLEKNNENNNINILLSIFENNESIKLLKGG